jgi:hypothetical protein
MCALNEAAGAGGAGLASADVGTILAAGLQRARLLLKVSENLANSVGIAVSVKCGIVLGVGSGYSTESLSP